MTIVPCLDVHRSMEMFPFLLESVVDGLLNGEEAYHIFLENLDVTLKMHDLPDLDTST